MDLDEPLRRAQKPPHEIGQPLDELSIVELQERILALRAEIERLEQAVGRKQASRASADSFFKNA